MNDFKCLCLHYFHERKCILMNKNAELLNFIYQNSQMGVETIDKLIKITEGERFKLVLAAQLEGYSKINDEAKEMLNKNGYDEKGIGAFEKMRTYLMINFQTLNDKSSSHIAEMLIIGSNMGVIYAIRNINKYKNAENDIVNLMEKLKSFEEDNIEKLKMFL